MTERLYGLSGKTPAKPMTGQAAIIFAVLGGTTGNAPEFLTAKQWTAKVEEAGQKDPAKDLKTRQDPYRVVMYYLLVFKKRELVVAREQNIAESERTISEALPEAAPGGTIERNPLDDPQTEDELQAAIERLERDEVTAD